MQVRIIRTEGESSPTLWGILDIANNVRMLDEADGPFVCILCKIRAGFMLI